MHGMAMCCLTLEMTWQTVRLTNKLNTMLVAYTVRCRHSPMHTQTHSNTILLYEDDDNNDNDVPPRNTNTIRDAANKQIIENIYRK